MYNNGVPRLQSLSKLKQQYDAIFQQNSSFRESLLVSPYCSKYQKQESPRQSIRNNAVHPGVDNNNSLLDYIRPFDSQQLNKTETKQKMRKKIPYEHDNRKRTEPDYDDRNISRQQNTGKFISELKQIIREKDQRIQILQKRLGDFGLKKISPTQQSLNQSPPFSKDQKPSQTHNQKSKRGQRQKKGELEEIGKQNYLYFDAQLANYKKQIRFLAYNNQEMFEELSKINKYCEKLKKTLSTTLLYVKDLQEKIIEITQRNQQLEEINQTLIIEKKEMMENYEEEVKLFKKMKNIWEGQNKQNGGQAHMRIKNQQKNVGQCPNDKKRSKSVRKRINNKSRQFF